MSQALVKNRISLAPLTQQPLPVFDEDFGQGHHLLV
jgi:hypothetical protein